MSVFAAISCVRESRPGGGSNLLVSKQTGRCRGMGCHGRRKGSGEIRIGRGVKTLENGFPVIYYVIRALKG